MQILPPTLLDDADDAIVAEVAAGDRARFEVLVRRYNRRLFRAARALLGDDSEAEDVVQQAYLKAYEALPAFRGDAQVSTWLARIVVHEAIDRLRRRRRHADLAAEVETLEPRTPEADAADHELGAALARAIDALPDGLRAVLVLRAIEELDTTATAAVLGLSDEAVRVRLHRARAALRTAVAELDGGGAGDLHVFLGARCDALTARVMAAIHAL
jgi:RNA polymerase sigma-70 factor (ECF subfamily)